ncbi:hypothetical protein O3Q51_13085 [Cryomorphaceae bacterium 1068]|nr:hypothetical protein [Cryomorphaceae bacterium 1068]
MKALVLFPLFLLAFGLKAQETDIAKMVTMDEFVVNAAMEDFNAEDFIKQVIEDTTFYQAFLNLKYFPHEIKGAMVVYDKDDSEFATLQRKAVQHLTPDEVKWVEITYEKTNGKIKKKNGKWRYLTAEVYDDVFFPTEKHSVSNEMVQREQELEADSKMEKHKAQLKKMLFNPGQPIDNVPFIGDKLAIFSPEMVQYYDYSIFLYEYNDSIPCIAFSSFVKEGEEDEVVIRDMTSYFHRDTKEVIARAYRLAHKTLLFDFDISIKVENMLVNGWLMPKSVSYDGGWDVPFKKPEIISFKMECADYETNSGRYAK